MSIPLQEHRTVFVSYAREDGDLVSPIVRLLRAAGVTVFVDDDIAYGDQWERVLLRRLVASERILLFWSKNAAQSEWVHREYMVAIENGLRVIPVPLDETPLPPALSAFQALTALVPLVYAAHRRTIRARVLNAWNAELGWSSWYRMQILPLFVFLAFSLFVLAPAMARSGPDMPIPRLVAFWLASLLTALLAVVMRGKLYSFREARLSKAIYACIFSGPSSGEPCA